MIIQNIITAELQFPIVRTLANYPVEASGRIEEVLFLTSFNMPKEKLRNERRVAKIVFHVLSIQISVIVARGKYILPFYFISHIIKRYKPSA